MDTYQRIAKCGAFAPQDKSLRPMMPLYNNVAELRQNGGPKWQYDLIIRDIFVRIFSKNAYLLRIY